MAKYAGMILIITSITLTIMPDFIKEHRCSYPGCRQVLVIDGNQKIEDLCALLMLQVIRNI